MITITLSKDKKQENGNIFFEFKKNKEVVLLAKNYDNCIGILWESNGLYFQKPHKINLKKWYFRKDSGSAGWLNIETPIVSLYIFFSTMKGK